MARYSSNSASGFDAIPPSDDGTVSESNKLKWSTIKSKLATPVKDLADAINADLESHFERSLAAITSNTTLGASHFNKFVSVSGSGVTLTLTDAATLGVEWYCDIINTDASNSVTLARATGGDTINGSAANLTIQAGDRGRVIVNAAADGFLTEGFPFSVGTLPVARGGTGQTSYTNGQLLIGNTTGNTLTKATLTAGTNIAITNSTGSITVATTGLGALATANSVNQSTIDNSSVGQGELKTTTGTFGFNYASTDLTLSSAHYAMPGGAYGFMPSFAISGSGSYAGLSVEMAAGIIAYGGGPISDTAYIRMQVDAGTASDSSGTATGTQRYVQASPPYDLGDGPVLQFAFLVVDSLGNARHVWSATEAPWHYNGPTNIAAHRVDRVTGRKYRRVHPLVAEFGSMREATRQIPRAAFFARMQEPEEWAEITQAMKQADMPLIPHPFANLNPGETVVMLDPVSPIMERLATLQDNGIAVGSILADGYLQFGNTALPRNAPPGVLPVSVNWRQTV